MLGAIVVVLLVAAAPQRLATEATPPLIVHRALAADVRLSGSAPVLAWPREGEAAMESRESAPSGLQGAKHRFRSRASPRS